VRNTLSPLFRISGTPGLNGGKPLDQWTPEDAEACEHVLHELCSRCTELRHAIIFKRGRRAAAARMKLAMAALNTISHAAAALLAVLPFVYG
jgi:hypothetical protein